MKASLSNIYNHVLFLTELRPFRNYKNLESLNKVTEYIISEFNKTGLEIEKQNWMVDGNEYFNIIGSYNKGKSKRLIIGAHYDVCGDQPGADDNASAIAGLLELARLIGEINPILDYQLDFVTYCLEEPPYFGTRNMGSFVHAESLKNNNTDVIGMICYEMIGYFSDEPYSQPFPERYMEKLYPNTANFIMVVGIDKYEHFNNKVFSIMRENTGIDVQKITFDDKNLFAGLSDQRNYWNFNFPALMINDTSFIRNPNYHLETDTIDTLNFEKLTEVVNSTYKVISKFN
jgi:hypothetical protein